MPDIRIRKFEPYWNSTQWGLNSQYQPGNHKNDDPMIPTRDENKHYIDSDEALIALAARTVHASKRGKV